VIAYHIRALAISCLLQEFKGQIEAARAEAAARPDIG
jgi:hypothetical protein